MARSSRFAQAALLLARGDGHAASRKLEERLQQLAAHRTHLAAALDMLIDACLSTGDLDTAASAVDRLSEVSTLADSQQLDALVLSARGRLSMSRRDTVTATAELQAAVAAWSRLELPFERARARLELGRALADTTHDAAVDHLRRALADFEALGAALTPMHVQRFLRDELAAGKGAPTVNQSLRTLRMALKQALMWGLVPRNVAALVEGVAERRPERRPFTPDEQRRIMDVARGDRLYIMVVLAQATGLRQSELLGVRWSDLDLEARVLRFRVQYSRDGVLRPPKSEAGVRLLPLPVFAATALREHRERQDQERAEAGEWDDRWDVVIATRNGRTVNHANARRSWNRIVERAGVEHRGIHHMRHAWVTMLAERGVHQRVAQQLAGHDDERMTARIYTHVTPPMFDVAAAAIDQAMNDLNRSNGGSNDERRPDRDGGDVGGSGA